MLLFVCVRVKEILNKCGRFFHLYNYISMCNLQSAVGNCSICTIRISKCAHIQMHATFVMALGASHHVVVVNTYATVGMCVCAADDHVDACNVAYITFL